MNPAVHMDGITKRFPGVVANDDVDLAVERGSVHALLGENGAGKTTLMNVLYGLYEPTEGTVFLDGEPQSFDSPRDAIDAGVGMIHQHFMLVDPMTVWENVVLGNEPKTWGGLPRRRGRRPRAVVELSERYGFDVDPDARIEDVSVGVQQRVEILKALYRGADVLILDEPTAVLTPQEVEDLYGVFEELTEQGKTIIFISHKLGEALSAADEITVLRDGVNVGTVASADVTREDLAEMMVGREVLMEPATTPQKPGDRVLEVTEVHADDDRGVETVSGISFELPCRRGVRHRRCRRKRSVPTRRDNHGDAQSDRRVDHLPRRTDGRREPSGTHRPRDGLHPRRPAGARAGDVVRPDRERYPRKPARPAVRRGRPARLARLS